MTSLEQIVKKMRRDPEAIKAYRDALLSAGEDMIEAAVIAFYTLGFAFLCHVAVRENTTVWRLLDAAFNDIAAGFGRCLRRASAVLRQEGER